LRQKLLHDITASNLKLNSTIELLRLRGRCVNCNSELELIQAELDRRQRWGLLAYILLIAGSVMLIIVLI